MVILASVAVPHKMDKILVMGNKAIVSIVDDLLEVLIHTKLIVVTSMLRGIKPIFVSISTTWYSSRNIDITHRPLI